VNPVFVALFVVFALKSSFFTDYSNADHTVKFIRSLCGLLLVGIILLSHFCEYVVVLQVIALHVGTTHHASNVSESMSLKIKIWSLCTV